MAESEGDSTHTTETTPTGGDPFAAQWAAMFSNLPQTNTVHKTVSLSNISLNTKLNEGNYSLWARLIRMKIGGQGKLHHLLGVPAPPKMTEPALTVGARRPRSVLMDARQHGTRIGQPICRVPHGKGSMERTS